MFVRRSIKQTGAIMALLSLLAVLTVSVGASVARAAGTCSQENNDDGTVTLTWDADGDDKWAVRAGVPGDNTDVAVIRDTPTFTGGIAGDVYTIRYVRQGGIEVPCTVPVEPPPPADFCTSMLLENGDVELTISDNDAKSWAWRRGKDGVAPSYKGEFVNFSAIDSAPTAGAYAYEVVSRLGGGVTESESCGTVTIENPDPVANVCSATLQDDGTVTITWDDNNARNWSIRRGIDGAAATYLAVGENFTYTDTTAPEGLIEYVIRAKFTDTRIEASCGTVTIEPDPGNEPVANVCSATLQDDGTVTITWDDNNARNWSIRRGIDGAAATYLAVGENFTYTDTTAPEGLIEYVIRAKFADTRIEASCGTVTIEPDPGNEPVANVCSATLQDDGTVTITWDDNNARNWSIRRGIDGAAATYLAVGENFTYTDTTAPEGLIEYVIRAKFADTRIEASCGTVTIEGDPLVAATCSAALLGDGTIELTWDDNDANAWSVRRGRNGATPTFKGETDVPGFIDTDVPVGGTVTYELVSRFDGGVTLTSDCGTVDLTPAL